MSECRCVGASELWVVLETECVGVRATEFWGVEKSEYQDVGVAECRGVGKSDCRGEPARWEFRLSTKGKNAASVERLQEPLLEGVFVESRNRTTL